MYVYYLCIMETSEFVSMSKLGNWNLTYKLKNL